jgi:hypothetical protein
MLWQIIFILVLLIPILAIVLDSQVGRALAARLERRGIGEGSDPMGERVAYLEGEVERLSGEVERLEEESQFLHRLLTERAKGEERALPPDRERDG